MLPAPVIRQPARLIVKVDHRVRGLFPQCDLSSLPLSERKEVAGINPERADIIIGGAVILETPMAELEIPEIRVSSRGLQDGLLADNLSRLDEYRAVREMGVRERSVLQMGRACGLEEQHATTTRSLALDLFDSAGMIGLHPYGERERELLAHAASLHDIGKFISYANPLSHSSSLVRNADLPGFDDTEVAIMAHVVRYHRKKFPGRKNQANKPCDHSHATTLPGDTDRRYHSIEATRWGGLAAASLLIGIARLYQLKEH